MQTRNLLIVVITTAVAFTTGYWFFNRLNEEASRQDLPRTRNVDIHGAMLPVARNIAVPALVRDDGSGFSQADLMGHWSVMFFGYTNCPDVCPTSMAVLKQAKDNATAEGLSFPQVIFVSVDPERDKVGMLGEYVRYFDKDFLGVTGDSKLVDALARQLSVVYMQVPAETGNPDDYTIDHSSAFMLLDPRGRLTAFLTAPHTPAGILGSIKTVMANTP